MTRPKSYLQSPAQPANDRFVSHFALDMAVLLIVIEHGKCSLRAAEHTASAASAPCSMTMPHHVFTSSGEASTDMFHGRTALIRA